MQYRIRYRGRYEKRTESIILTGLSSSSMPEFTLGERLLLHLYNFRSINLADYYNIPWDITQDGIATSLRISRAHASLELKKHKEKGNVNEAQVRIYGGKVRRFAYTLTENGLKAAMDVEEKARNAGIDVRTLIDLKKQDSSALLDNLGGKDRMALGVACALRISVPADSLPPHDRSTIPMEPSGYTSIVPELRNRILAAADPEEIRLWDSYAADYYDKDGQHSAITDEDCRMVERTYHLLRAGRYVDACKVIERNLYAMILSDDRGFYETVRDVPLESVKDRYLADFLTLRAELALSQNDLKTAREASERLVTIDGGQEYGYACLTECLILRKKDSEAAEMIRKVNGSGNALGMVKLAETYLDLGEIDKAEEQMDAAVRIISDNNIAAVAQRFLVQARIDAAKGQTDDANRHISKAYFSTNEIGKRNVKAIAKDLGLTIS